MKKVKREGLNPNYGYLEMIVGPTKAGKTCELIAELRNKGRGRKTLVVNHEKDEYKGFIFSPPHVKEDSETVDGLNGLVLYIRKHFKDFDMLFIDNVHLFNESFNNREKDLYIDDLIEYLTYRGKRVFATGVEFDVEGNMMDRVPELLSRAEYIKKMKTLCPICASQGFIKEIATRSKIVHGETIPVDLFHYYHPNQKMTLERIPSDFTFIVGPMWTQKTFSSQGQYNKYDWVGKWIKKHSNQEIKTIYIKPIIDERYYVDLVYSHDDVDVNDLDEKGRPKPIVDLKIPCFNIDTINEFYDLIKKENPKVVLYEEMEFHSFADEAAEYMMRNNITVIGSALDMDVFTKPFKSAPKLLAMATNVIKRRGRCSEKGCDYDSTRTYRIPEAGEEQIVVGGVGDYFPMCRYHYTKKKGNRIPNNFGLPR